MSLPLFILAARELVAVVSDRLGAWLNVARFSACLIVWGIAWGRNVSHVASLALHRLLYGSEQMGGGFRVDLRETRRFIDEDDLEGAIKCLEHELGKDTTHFEARMLLATIYHELRDAPKGLKQLDFIKQNPLLTSEQHSIVGDAEHQLRILQLRIDAGQERPPEKRRRH